MNLSTPVNIIQSETTFSCKSNVLAIGSCFSDNIGRKLLEHQFETLINPFGTVFNPISLCRLIQTTLDNTPILQEDIRFQTDRYFHFDYHSSFDGIDIDSVISKIMEARNKVADFIVHTDILILTFGTSIAYKFLEDDAYVSNCHKVPSGNFQRQFIPLNEMTEHVEQMIIRLHEINPKLKIILTVSPVRHTKEGLVDNNRSKARLIELCHYLEYNLKDVTYFPSYEIILDELRDYRFYDNDMIHPTPLAIDVIWDKFTKAFFEDKAIEKVRDINQLNRAMNHRPFNPQSEGHEKFCQTQLNKIEKLKQVYQEVDFSIYINHFTTS